jgi:hypothetical protein
MYKNLIYEKYCDLKVYMHFSTLLHEHFDLITNPFQYKCQISQVFIYPFQKIMVSAKCNSWIVDLTTLKANAYVKH